MSFLNKIRNSKLGHYFLGLYFITFTVCVLFSIDYWPLTNFSMFRSKERLNTLLAFQWIVKNSENGKTEIIEFRDSHVHDSFTTSMLSLRKKKKDPRPYIKSFIGQELKVLGLDGKYDSVKVNRFTFSDKKNVSKDFCLKNERGTYCLLKEEMYNVEL